MDRWSTQKPANDRAFAGVKGTRWIDPTGIRRVSPLLLHGHPPDGVDLHEPRLLLRLQLLRDLGVLRAPHALSLGEEDRRSDGGLRRAVHLRPDDNFLTNKRRATELCDELEKRGVKKYWLTQGRTDFAADHPELMARLAKNGLVMVLSGFESNDDDNLAALRKKSSWQKNLRANDVMRQNGIFSTGVFMIRADWTHEQFELLYDYVRSLQIAMPLFTILTPLPGMQLYRAYKDKLLTRSYDATEESVRNAYNAMMKARPGLMNGPGARAGLTWKDIAYPKGDENEINANKTNADVVVEQKNEGKLVRLRISKRTWADDVADASSSRAGVATVGE